MPLWLIYHPVGTFESASSKKALAKSITEIYTEMGLPAFYVVVNFVRLPVEDIYVGGETRVNKPLIRIMVDHVAVHMENKDESYARATARFDAALKPHILDKGYDYEYQVDETERRLWKINGLVPPPFKSEEEQIWVRENRPVP